MLINPSSDNSWISPTNRLLLKRKVQLAILLPLVLLTALALGCGSSSEPAQSTVADTASGSAVEVGYRVGQSIRPFTLRLVDGTTLSSTELINQNQPTMLFFFKIG